MDVIAVAEFFGEDQEGGGKTQGRSVSAGADTRFAEQVITRLTKHGWIRNYVVKAMAHITDDATEDWHPSPFAQAWAKWKVRNAHGDLETILQEAGLRTEVIRHVIPVCMPLYEYYSDVQLAEIAVEYLFARPMTSSTTTHPFQPDLINTWFAGEETSLPYINVPYNCSVSKLVQVHGLVESKFANHDRRLFFHATCWNSSLGIMEGIVHAFGRPCLDFGYRPSFYISDSLQLAIEFGEKLRGRYYNEIAILVFSLPTEFPNTLRHKELDGTEWMHITQKSRLCVTEDTMREMPELRDYDLVGGKMVYNVRQVYHGTSEPIAHTPPKYQLASKKARGDLFLQDHLVGCVYFQKYLPHVHM